MVSLNAAADVYHLGVSGRDSAATLLWLVHESGWDLHKARVTFCDTANEDPLTYACLTMLSERVFPVERIQPELGFYDLAQRTSTVPQPLRCTSPVPPRQSLLHHRR